MRQEDLLLGWRVHYSAPFCAATRATDVRGGLPPEATVLVGAALGDGRGSCLRDRLEVAAAGLVGPALAETARGTAPTAHNGAHWYLESGHAFGFADGPVRRRRGGADTEESGEAELAPGRERRLSRWRG
ncbi:unnamed protein product [Prorocentrum cordatum]|uniref:Uncharacterized protein n=1 Tax=Prorocentrum cordatum TaxID=2364126 RepID=A0ABN9UZM4_9DINO|nr:unnamed protein product [Polarella glacialis]